MAFLARLAESKSQPGDWVCTSSRMESVCIQKHASSLAHLNLKNDFILEKIPASPAYRA